MPKYNKLELYLLMPNPKKKYLNQMYLVIHPYKLYYNYLIYSSHFKTLSKNFH
jgi:hypothetical protein